MFGKKYDPNFFEIPFRPPHEFAAAAAWLIGGALTVFALRSPFPHFPFKVAAGVCLSLALLRAVQGYPYWRDLRSLRKRKPLYVDVKKLSNILRKSKTEGFYIGDAYVLDTTTAERVHEIVRRGPERLLPKAASEDCRWLQRVGKPEPRIIPLKYFEGQTMLVGAPGSGKTVGLATLVTQAIMRGDPVVIIDPKGDKDLMSRAKETCEQLGQPDRFVYFNPAFPQISARIDPLANWNRTTEPASRTAALIPSETGSDPFTAFGWKSLNAIGQGLISLEERPNLMKFVRYVEGTPEDLVVRVMKHFFDTKIGPAWEGEAASFIKAARAKGEVNGLGSYYREKVVQRFQSRTIESLLSVYEHNREHFGKMVASLIPVLSMLTTPPLDELLSPSEKTDSEHIVTNFSQIIQTGKVVYCALDSLSDKIIGSALGSMFLADLTAVAGDRYNYGVDESRHVWVLVDEAAEVLNDPCIQLLNKGRGANFHVILAAQTLADFEARTGSAAKARMVLGNVNNTFCMRVKDGDSRDYISEKLPKVYIRRFNRSFSSMTGSDQIQHTRGGYSERVEQEEVPIIPPNLLESLPNWEYVATLTDGTVLKGVMPITRRPLPSQQGSAAAAAGRPDDVDIRRVLAMGAPRLPANELATPAPPVSE